MMDDDVMFASEVTTSRMTGPSHHRSAMTE